MFGVENVTGGAGNDTITGSDEVNDIAAGGGADEIFGLGGVDVIHGNAGTDTIDGGDGDDQLFGDTGNDTLIGGLGADDMNGGNDADQFVWRARNEAGTSSGGEDRMLAFSLGQGDTLAFDDGFFTGVVLPGDFEDAGHVNADYFQVVDVVGTGYGGSTGAPTFVFDSNVVGANGVLWFDADGNGDLTGANDVKIATFDTASNVATITNSHLLLI
jgi:Ca2+-binding RTX toxin-like protein